MSRGASRKDHKPQPVQSVVGAVQSKTKYSDQFRSYWGHHKTSFSGSLARLLSTPVQTLMTSLVVAIALALPAILFVALDNMEQLGRSWDADPKISVYIKSRAREAAIDKLQANLAQYQEVSEVEYISSEQALSEFQELSGFGGALSVLDENPLPATLVLSLADPGIEPDRLAALAEKIEQEPIVDEVNFDMDWVRRLQELMQLGKKLIVALASLLGLGVLLAVGNTIRLAIENRREEILVAKLVGGTNGFVRRPFLYAGWWYGFIGGVLACFIVVSGFFFLKPTVDQIAFLYESQFSLQGLGVSGALQLIIVSTLLGLCGAWLAVGRHLAKIEPR